MLPDNQTINVLFKEPFKVSAKAIVPKFGAVSITFQDDFLTLQNASIDDTNIVWTLDSLKLGSTQIRVTSKLEKLMHTQFCDVSYIPSSGRKRCYGCVKRSGDVNWELQHVACGRPFATGKGSHYP
jgi:hypothetical protein